MDNLHIAQLIALSMTVALAVFAAALLLMGKAQRRDQAVFLAGFLLLYGFFKLNSLILMTDAYFAAPNAGALLFPVQFLLGPAIYFYARSMTAAAPRWLTRRDAWALILPVVALLSIIPFLLMTIDEQIALMTQNFVSDAQRAWFLFMCKFLFGLFLLSALGPLMVAFRLLLRHTRQVRDLFSNIEDKSLNWLRVILLIIAIGWVWHTLAGIWAIEGGKPAWVNAATAYFELGWIGAIAFCGVLQRPVFDEKAAALEAARAEETKYARSALDGERKARIAAKLDQAMIRDKLFSDPALSLRRLAAHVGISEYYISQTLNEDIGQNFFDFVNGHRVGEARRRLDKGGASIVAIARQVGFNSRSTFNAAFKKHVGMTPSAYRQSIEGRSNPLETAQTS